MRVPRLAVVVLLCTGAPAAAQQQESCRILCAPEFSVEPTITVSNLFRAPRVVDERGVVSRARRDTEFELILSFGLPTRLSWLEFTVEAIVMPFDHESTPELEFETNLHWLPGRRTRGWLSSHFDIVDKFSSAERPTDDRAYTHKLNFELDTSLAVFNWLREGRWLRGIELEASLDYVATGLARKGDVIGGHRYADNASPWSLSFVFVIPIAPINASARSSSSQR